MVNGDLPDFCCSFKFSNKKTFRLHFKLLRTGSSNTVVWLRQGFMAIIASKYIPGCGLTLTIDDYAKDD